MHISQVVRLLDGRSSPTARSSTYAADREIASCVRTSSPTVSCGLLQVASRRARRYERGCPGRNSNDFVGRSRARLQPRGGSVRDRSLRSRRNVLRTVRWTSISVLNSSRWRRRAGQPTPSSRSRASVSSCSRVRCLGCAFTRHLPAAAGETLTSTRPRAGASPAVRESASATCPGAGAACRVACHQRATTKARSTLAPWGRGRWACIRRQGLLDRVGVECPHPAGAQCECCPPGTCGRRPPSASHPCEGVQGDRPCCAQRLRRPVLFGEGWLATLSRCPDLTLRWSPPCPSRRRLPTWRPSSG